MNIKHCGWTKLFLAALVVMPFSACGHQVIPKSELKEIKQLAFSEAQKNYILTAGQIESKYKPLKFSGCSEVEDKAKTKAKEAELNSKEPSVFNGFIAKSTTSCIDDVQFEQIIPAVASVRGIKLIPRTPTHCIVKFDFEQSSIPQTKLPINQATAERFERPDGTHYWVIVW